MSKSTVKCPGCGKQVPSAMRFCGWCGFDLKVGGSQRVDSLPRPGQPAEKSAQTAPLPQTPPAASPPPAASQPGKKAQQSAQPAQQPVQQPVQPPKAPAKKPAQPVQKPVPQQKPVNPNRHPAAAKGANNTVPPHKKNTGLIIAILAVAAVIIIVAVVLIVKTNTAGDPPVSDEFDSVHVMSAAGEDESTEAPEPTAAATPDPTEAPEPEEEDPNGTVYVTGSGVNLRSGPGTAYDVIGSLPRGTELERTGTTNGWSQVIYDGEECYISSALVSTEKPEDLEEPEETAEPAGEEEPAEETAEPAEEPAEETAEPETPEAPASTVSDTVVVVSSANIRSGPGTDYESLGTVSAGTELERIGVSGDWSKVKYNDGEGYIFNSLITEKGEAGTLTVVSKANVRSGPGTGYDIVGVVDVGDVLTMKDHTESNWYEVDLNGQTGYIAGNMVKEN